MNVTINPDRSFRISWELDELDGRTQAALVLHPVRIYQRQPIEDIKIQVARTEELRLQWLPEYLPDGLYEYCLADCESGEKLTRPPSKVYFGERRIMSVTRQSLGTGYLLTIRSPLRLRAGECGINYGLSQRFPLPQTQQEGDEYVMRCILRMRPELPEEIWLHENLRQMLKIEERSYEGGGDQRKRRR